MKRKMLVSFISLFVFVSLTACGGFDEETAIDESKEQLEAFFKTYENMEVISPMETKALKESVHDSFSDFFTKDYLSQIDQEIESVDITEVDYENPILFFMDDNSVDKAVKFNQYELLRGYEFIPDKKNKTLSVMIGGVGTPKNMFIELTLKNENGDWKIDGAERK